MIDLNAVKCVGMMAAAVIVGYVLLRLFEWGWGKQGKPPLKEKSAKQKAQQKKRARRAAQMIEAPESRWKRPGIQSQILRSDSAMPIFGEGQPRHIRIDDTPHVIITPVIADPLPSEPTVLNQDHAHVRMKPVDVPAEQQPSPPAPKTNDVKPNKINKSNRTMPMKRVK